MLRVFGRLPDTGVNERMGAGVRKASGEETAGRVAAGGDVGLWGFGAGIWRNLAIANEGAGCAGGAVLQLGGVGGIGTAMWRRATCVLAVGAGADGSDRRRVAVAGGIPAWTRRSDAG